MNRQHSQVKVFAYRDYRLFLKDWFEHSKMERRGFSHRSFANKAGFKTSNFLLLVIKNKRNLTEESLAKVIQGLDLNKQESEFFRNLVFLNQASAPGDRDQYYQRMIQSKKFSELKPIEKQQYQYYSKWYHPVIRELVCSREFDGTAEWISDRLYPQITPAQCAKSIELLENLGFIKKNSANRYEQASSIISTGAELHSLIIHNYHTAMLDLTKLIMNQLPVHQRDTSTLTLGVKKERIPQLRESIRRFRQEILSMVASDHEPEEVAQLNIQFFPVTRQWRDKTDKPSGSFDDNE